MKSNDQNFIQRLQRQREDALEFVVDRYLPLVKGITVKVIGPLKNEGMIDECVNDIFLSIWHHADTFTGEPADFKKWVCVIAKFKAIDYYRKAGRAVEVEADHLERPSEKSAEDAVIDEENRQELVQLIHSLEGVDRRIFTMKFFLGFQTNEIAAELGMTRAAVENRIYRGKKKLHQRAPHFHIGGSIV